MTHFNALFLKFFSIFIFIFSLQTTDLMGSEHSTLESFASEDDVAADVMVPPPLAEGDVIVDLGRRDDLPRDSTIMPSERVTRFTDIPNTLEDDQARCGADFWSISRNVLGSLAGVSELTNLAFSTLSQTTWVSAETAAWCLQVGVVSMWLTPILTAAAAGAHSLVKKRKTQGVDLAREYNLALGLEDPESESGAL